MMRLARLLRERSWNQISRGAVAVLLASQRESGLWPLPLNHQERNLTYSKKNSAEGRLRLEDPFGSDSITVTRFALEGLARSLGAIPIGTLTDAFRAVEDLRRNGAYGRRRENWKAEAGINESPRHTAAALIINTSFGDHVSPKSDMEHRLPTVRWLLSHSLPEGGWLYQQLHAENGPEPLSTASAIAALGEFEVKFGSKALQAGGLVERYDRAMLSGFDKLLGMCRDGLWWFEHDHTETQFIDSAEVAIMMLRALNSAALSHARPTGRQEVLKIARTISEHTLSLGMPRQIGSKIVSLPSTISVLSLLDEFANSELSVNDTTRKTLFEEMILKSIAKNGAWTILSTWDWCVLVGLARRRASAHSEFDANLIDSAITTRSLGFAGRLTKKAVHALPAKSRDPVSYALTRGQPGSMPSGRFTASFETLPKSMQILVGDIRNAVIALLVTGLLTLLFTDIGRALRQIIN